MVDLDLHRMRLLRELEVRGTLHAVAVALSYSPSAVSQQLAVLEREVGVRLLEKAGRGVRLTDAAHVLARHAAGLLSAAEAAAADLASLSRDVRGVVRASGLQSATRHILIPAAAGLTGEHPQLRLEVSELELEQALPDLLLGSLDVVVSDEYDGHPRPRPAGLAFTVLHEEPLKLVLPAAHPQAEHAGPVDVAALRRDVWTSSAAGTGHHAVVVGTCRALGGFEPDLRYRSNDADVQLGFVRATAAVALLPTLILPPSDPALAVRDAAGAVVGRRLVIVTREGPTSPALEVFLTAVTRRAHELVRDPPGTSS